MAAAASEAPAFDLTSALLSKMQGAAPGAATTSQSVGQSTAHATPTTSNGQPAGATAAAAAGGSAAAVMGAPAAAAAASPAAYNRAAAAEPAPVPAALAVGVRASAVPEPEYLALDFEDVRADGGITDEEMLELAATSSSNSSGRVRKQSRGAGSSKRAAAGVIKARAQGGKWASIQAEAGNADATKLPEQPPAAALPAADAGSPQQQQSPITEAAPGTPAGRSQGVDAAALCNIQQFSPVGLRGVAEPVVCPAPRLRFYSSGGFVFRPLTIPVIFHCKWTERGPAVLRLDASSSLQQAWTRLPAAAVLSQAQAATTQRDGGLCRGCE